jgi:UPF0271 protein
VVTIDLNADIGEGMPYDHELLKYISSCNIACGGHTGDDKSMLKTINLAKKNEVKIGAHPSYPDKVNFGRKSIDISIDELIKSIDSQLQNFNNFCEQANAEWHHIKFHGALYNDLKIDNIKADALINLITTKYSNLILYVPPNSIINTIAKENSIPVKIEGFADRRYNDDLSLVSRNNPNAVILDKDLIIKQVNQMLLHQKVQTENGKDRTICIQTLCLHGDTPKALELVESIYSHLRYNNISIG